MGSYLNVLQLRRRESELESARRHFPASIENTFHSLACYDAGKGWAHCKLSLRGSFPASSPPLLDVRPPFVTLTTQIGVQDSEKMETPYPDSQNSPGKEVLNK